MHRGRLVFVLLAGIGLVSSGPPSAEAASFLRLGALVEEPRALALGISADGTVVAGPGENFTNFRWDAVNGLAWLGREADGVFGERAVAVSGDGSTIVGEGYEYDPLNGRPAAVRWVGTNDPLALPALDRPPNDFSSSFSRAWDVSYDGSVIVGESEGRAFRWDAGNGVQEIGDGSRGSFATGVSDDGSVVVGSFAGGSVLVGGRVWEGEDIEQSFRWDAESGLVPLGWLPTDSPPPLLGGGHGARGVSADGKVVVGLSPSGSGTYQAFRWDAENGMVGLGAALIEGEFSGANETSADGSLLVGYFGRDPFGDPGPFSGREFRRAVYWDATGQMHDLEIVLRTLGIDLEGWTLNEAYDVSADGRTIIGAGFNPDGDYEGWIAVIPEPRMALLLGIGLAVLSQRRPSTTGGCA